MTTDADMVEMPGDFMAVRAMYPIALERELGYTGQARFIAFYWDSEEDDAFCRDGQSEPASGNWQAFVRYVAPLGPYFKVSLGSSDQEATHFFVWDRARQTGYLAPRESAEEFLESQG